MSHSIHTAWDQQEVLIAFPVREDLEHREIVTGLSVEHAIPGDLRSPLSKTPNQLVKRGFDIIIASLVIAGVLFWMLPLLWIINRLVYRQDVFFVQERNGLNNEIFSCIKFKTMIDTDEANLKSAAFNDPRITPIGRYLRRSGLDEVPQFLNVFFGHMSVVGPRPHMIFHTEQYRKLIPGFMHRHSVKPGLTGLAQVNGCRGSIHSMVHLRQRVNYDLAYIKNWTLWMDIKIFLFTIISIFKGGTNAW